MDLTFQVPMQYCSLQHQTLLLSPVTSTTGYCFLLWLHPLILSGVVSPLISSSILGTYRPGEFLFQCPIFLPFHTVHWFLKARILKWFAIPFSSGPHSVRPLHHDLSILGGPTRQRMKLLDGITDSMAMNLSKLLSWWWIGRPGMLQSMGSQRVGHDWATELNWLNGTEVLSWSQISDL